MMSVPILGPPIGEQREASGSSGSSAMRPVESRADTTSSSASEATSRTLTPISSNDAQKPTAPKADSDESSEESSESGEKEEWGFTKQLKTDQHLLESRDIPPNRSLHLAYKDLCVRGVGSADDVTYAPDVGAIIMPWKNIHYARKAKKLAAARAETDEKRELEQDERLKKKERFLLKDFNGLVKAGEMMLVVGRPGSGCTTFLKALAGLHEGYAGVDGDIYYGDMSGDKALKPYKTDVIFNPEEDIFDPNLTVGRTLDFALRMNTPAPGARLPKEEGGDAMTDVEYRDKMKADLMDVLGLSHTHDTKVGDQYVRGVSGGEKKRVSIAEVLTSGASVQMWDNATRGLDADTALRYTRIIRALTDVQRNASVVSLYQAGNGIYDQFDKVTVIAEGQVLFYGPRAEARGYFEDMGFVHPDGGNTADFLTSVTALNERQVKDGKDVPTTARDFAKAYSNSEIARRMKEELDQHLGSEALRADTVQAQEELQRQKDRRAIKSQPQRANYWTQVKAALIRDYQQRWGDQWTLWARQATTLIQALLAGSTFYMIQDTTNGLFTRGGVIFLTILYPSLISLAETTAAFSGRAVTSKHKAFSMYRPSAVYIAQTIGDLPIFFVQITVYTIIIYFMANLKRDPGLYFTYLLITYVTTLCTTAFFRFIGYSFGTFENASKVSGFLFSVIVTYAGYVIYTPQMKPWFAWIRWINPIYYAVEALAANELYDLQVQCEPPQLAPYGAPQYQNGPAACAIAGAQPGDTTLSGTAWMQTALSFYKSHVWRNFGIIVAILVLFIALCIYATESIPAAGSTKAILLYKRGGGGRYIRQQKEEEKEKEKNGKPAAGQDGQQEVKNEDVHAENTVFTWKELTYTVQNGGKDLVLLDKVSGYCKAGTLTALMGSSGAGKTTLMDVLAARKTEGEIHGEVLMNGRQLPVSFQRTTGYCEQVDVHLPQATVREALEFSALLRQPRSVSDKDKLAYVDTIIDLLELHDIEDAMIGTPGAGLGVEQRKRLTIGVELVSKPSLLFLDEPTSGLDGQSSFIIVQFLRKLAAAGQAVLCTIHQPSASLFAQFDQLLLLKKGGKTVYFGPVDHLSEYFGEKGAPIPKDVNPAERMIDIVSGDLSKDKDWAQEWLDSKESKESMKELEQLMQENGEVKERDDDKYEYASSTATQLRIVTSRASTQLYRNTEYVTNKVFLHIGAALFNGFSFWMIGNSYADLQNRLFTVFNFIFVAPGVIAQTQPKFIANRDVFEAREKKAKLYSWWAFCFGEIVAEVPYLLVCAFLYWACWWPVVGFPFSPYPTGPVFLQMVLYEFLYTGIGQFIAAYAPSAVFAALVNPIIIGVMVLFCGVLVPATALPSWWFYWLYYLNPFTYLVGGLLNPILWDVQVRCTEQEFGVLDPPGGQTCGEYMSAFLQQATGYLDNPDATSQCRYCSYASGDEYLRSLDLGVWVYGWRNICLTLLFVLSSYGFVFLLLKLRSKQSKKASK